MEEITLITRARAAIHWRILSQISKLLKISSAIAHNLVVLRDLLNAPDCAHLRSGGIQPRQIRFLTAPEATLPLLVECALCCCVFAAFCFNVSAIIVSFSQNSDTFSRDI